MDNSLTVATHYRNNLFPLWMPRAELGSILITGRLSTGFSSLIADVLRAAHEQVA